MSRQYVIFTGLNKTNHPQHLQQGEMSDMRNMECRDGTLNKRLGFKPLYPSQDPWGPGYWATLIADAPISFIPFEPGGGDPNPPSDYFPPIIWQDPYDPGGGGSGGKDPIIDPDPIINKPTPDDPDTTLINFTSVSVETVAPNQPFTIFAEARKGGVINVGFTGAGATLNHSLYTIDPAAIANDVLVKSTGGAVDITTGWVNGLWSETVKFTDTTTYENLYISADLKCHVGASIRVPLSVINSIAGMIWWWEADFITGLSGGDPISTIPDSSGNGNTLTGVGAARPTWETAVINSLPAMRFDGTDDNMIGSSAYAPTGAKTMFFLAKQSVKQASAILGENDSDSSKDGIELVWKADGSFQPFESKVAAGDVWSLDSGQDDSGSFLVFTIWWDGTTDAGKVKLYRGRSVVDTDTATTVGAPGFTATEMGSLLGGGSLPFDGDIVSSICYNSSLSDGDLSLVWNYFNNKYNLGI